MATIDDILRQRYGGDRFNPAAGQTQMSFQEWMDRHPSLQGRGGAQNFDAYYGATQKNNRPAGAGADVAQPQQFQMTGPPGESQPLGMGPGSAAASGPTSPLPATDAPGIQLPGPDQPPTQGAAKGGGYRDFLNKSWGKGAQSNRTRAAAFRRQDAKKKGPRDTGKNNVQQAH